MTSPQEITDLLAAQKAAFRAEGEVTYATRRNRLERLAKVVLRHHDALVAALQEDFGNRSPFATRAGDILGSVAAIEYHLEHLEAWMQPEPIALPVNLQAEGTQATLHYEPLGVLGAIIPWNGPVLMACLAAMGGFAAGNRVMLKLSEMAPATGEAFAAAVVTEFDATELAVVNGDAKVAAAFSSQPFDHLLFTGSTATGRRVMLSAAENLVPVTLELGGKTPVVVGKSADLRVAANRIIAGKLASAGQVCVAPDYVFLPKGSTDRFVSACLDAVKQQYPDLMETADYTCLIHENVNAHMRALLDDAKSKGALLTFCPQDYSLQNLPQAGRFPLVLLTQPRADMTVMFEEIFGPILPIMEYESIDDALASIADGPHPLSAAYFGDDTAEAGRVSRAIQTGSVVINDVRLQLAIEALPFGGVGNSGMGRYRGHAGFVSFSNRKVVLRQGAAEDTLAKRRTPIPDAAHEAIEAQIQRKKAQYGV